MYEFNNLVEGFYKEKGMNFMKTFNIIDYYKLKTLSIEISFLLLNIKLSS